MQDVYLDWNVLNNIEKKDFLDKESNEIYSKIEKLIFDKRIQVPYSNAHINDLVRGFEKNPAYINRHLKTISNLTNNLCIVQYWGNEEVTWHSRDVFEFFNSTLESRQSSPKHFSDLFSYDDSGMIKAAIERFKLIPVDQNLLKAKQDSQLFDQMFPGITASSSMYDMIVELYAFTQNIRKDYVLFKSLKTFIIDGLKNNPADLNKIDSSFNSKTPAHLVIDKVWDKHMNKSKTSSNESYQLVTSTFTKYDFKGYKTDEKFSNLIDDSLHAFYGAHCEYFVTIDDKCNYKATQTFKELNIDTKVVTPQEFVLEFQQVLSS